MKQGPQAFFRILDANYNRAKEALRVSEDVVRFIMDDRALTARYKSCRHELTQSLLKMPVSYKKLLLSRDSAGDVGKAGWIQDKKGRIDWQDILCSNLKRAQESLRVLEETSKVIAPRQSPAFQKLRFSLYELEKRTIQKL